MSDHHCQTCIITCIDFRFQEYINKFIEENFPVKSFDKVSLAGGVFDFETILKQVEISKSLHHINKVLLINHEDCGAYGKSGTFEKHIEDLNAAEKKMEALFPSLDVETYYLHLDGTFEEVSKTNPHKNNWKNKK